MYNSSYISDEDRAKLIKHVETAEGEVVILKVSDNEIGVFMGQPGYQNLTDALEILIRQSNVFKSAVVDAFDQAEEWDH